MLTVRYLSIAESPWQSYAYAILVGSTEYDHQYLVGMSSQFYSGYQSYSGVIAESQYYNNFAGITLTQVAVSSVPETDTYAMLLAGLCLIGFVTGRKQK